MELYVKRMIVEKKELDGKIKKGKEAIKNNPIGMDETDKRLLSEQIEVMTRYSNILNNRILYAEHKRG